MVAQTEPSERIATIALVGAGLLILTSALFPRAADPADYAGVLDVLANDVARTRFVLLAVPLSIWVLAAGIGALHSRVEDPAAATWLRLGLHAMLIGAAAVTVQFAPGPGQRRPVRASR